MIEKKEIYAIYIFLHSHFQFTLTYLLYHIFLKLSSYIQYFSSFENRGKRLHFIVYCAIIYMKKEI